MQWRLAALCSLGVNVLLALGWYLAANGPDRVDGDSGGPTQGPASGENGRTNFVVRRLPFSWRELESTDYATYIANLRQIGCPEQTIRDIIIADVNALYSKRFATELVTADQQWWRSEPDPDVLLASAAKARELDDERRALLERLLGPSWEGRDLGNLPRPSRPGLNLDGPVLGVLASDAREAVQDISFRSEERIQAYMEERARQGLPPDPVELAKLRQQTRTELARVLPPPELEEFLLRYSQNAGAWRAQLGELRFFNANPEEFRALFRATDAIDQRLELLGDGDHPNTALARKALQEQREQAIRVALGPKRYEEYRNLQDPIYREAVAAATASGNPEAARVIYQVNLAAAQEMARITNSPLTPEQKQIELKELELEQLKANTLAAGHELPPEPPTPTPRRTYTFRPGDSAAVVALIHGVPVTALRAANPNVDLDRLRPGDSITIPRGALTPPVPRGAFAPPAGP